MPTTTPLTREEVREAILDAVDRLLARYGYRKMTMDDIAHEVGIGKGTIYLHFASKEEVTLSHVDRIVERLKERLWALARSEADVSVRLRQMLLTRVLFRFDSVQHYTQSLNDLLAALRPTLLARRARYFEEEARVFAEVLNEGQRTGVFLFRDAIETAFALLHATNSLLPYSLSTTELGEREEIKEKTEQIAELLLNGLLRDPLPARGRRRGRARNFQPTAKSNEEIL
ncbi:MAG TPA: TetR/AcrR family transcriptional regulator [Pyrinomonadaceae bacterium]|nr:TetR/AcrR family transcriptional regulator [Pyrinomonadaceae bacterium]